MTTTPTTVVAGRYRLLRQLGAGGMGQVWLAHDEMLDRHVAIKQVVLPPGLSADEADEARSRTLREARTAAQLNHPSVVKIYDVIQIADQPWIVMEYIPSRSLQEVINEDGPLEPVQVARIGLAVLDALLAAHQAGILHRDVKPGNVLMALDDRVVLTDFGLATFDGGESALTLPGLVFGSVRFVAPERARDGTSSTEADLWALGATLYAAVEGRSPYGRATAMETLTALATALPDPPRRAGPLKPVLRGLLRRNPRQRLTAADARRMLRQVAGADKARIRDWLIPRQLQRRPADGPTLRLAVPTDTAKAPTVVLTRGQRPVAPAEPPASARPRRRPWRVALAALGAALVVATVTVVVVATADTRGTRHAAAPPPASVAPTSTDPVLDSGMCPTENQTELRPASREPDWPALLTGWVWYKDPTGFRIAVPGDWHAYAGAGGMCFRELGDGRWLGVTAWNPAADPLGHVAGRERALLLASPSAYQREHLSSVPYYQGGADWEFDFQKNSGLKMHGVVRDFLVAPGRGYTIIWCTTEFDWTVNLDNFRMIIASFGPPD
jgi:tRNA A-37 threonylcarbamoyl transferase component Bud32